jgi:hypothetical protein
VQDYSIECWSDGYAAFAAYVIFMLVVFTFGLPLLVSGMLLLNRNVLYNPKVHATMGFLYARFQKGSEFWEMHEVVRKCALMGLVSVFSGSVETFVRPVVLHCHVRADALLLLACHYSWLSN